MRTREEIRAGISRTLKDLRERKKLSKAKMARKVGVDDHTWNSWETGKTAPSIIDFLTAFEACGESMLRPMLELLYPEQYSETSTQKREQLKRFIINAATDHHVDVLSYIVFGDHGSNFAPQVELYCAYNHLPMEQRFIIAEIVYTSFLTAYNRRDLLGEEEVMPDMETWQNGLKQAQKAAYKRLQSYKAMEDD